MNPRQVELALKKQRLQMQSAALRDNLAVHGRALQPVFAIADRGLAVVRWVRHNPALPVATVVALLVARPRGVLRWLRRGWFAWQALGKLRSFLGTGRVGNR